MSRRALHIIACCLALGGCTVGPNYRRPSVDMQHKFAATEAGSSSAIGTPSQSTSRPSTVQQGGYLPQQWWTTLGDSTLDTLIDRAIRSNLDLRSATASIRQARAQWAGAKAGLFPTATRRRRLRLLSCRWPALPRQHQ